MTDPVARTETQIGEDAVNAIIAQTRDLTDLSPLAPLSIMARGAWAPELAGLFAAHIQWAEGFYPHTATGEALDRILANFGLARREAEPSYGPVVCRRLSEIAGAPAGTDAQPIVIPAGYTVAAVDADGQQIAFALRDAVTIPVGDEQATCTVDASAPGARGRIGARALTELTGGPIDGLASITNDVAFTTGRDRDGDTEARQVFFDWLAARTRGTVAALRYAALSYEEIDDTGAGRRPVLSASVREHLDEPGPLGQAVTVYVMGHNGAFLTLAQEQAIRARIDGYTDAEGREVEGWRAAGVPVHVDSPVLLGFTVEVLLELSSNGGPATLARLKRALTAHVAALPIGAPFRRKAIFDEICKLGSEVTNATILAPAADILASPWEKLILDALLVAEG